MNDYVPSRGDIVWIDLDPRMGREQSGHRLVLVLSAAEYNRRRGMLIGCPLTSQLKGNPFEVVVTRNPPSSILTDQVRALDWQARGARFKERSAPELMAEVVAKIGILIGD